MVAIDANAKPAVSSGWLLRNDKKYIIAYKNDADALNYYVFSPLEASIISLFDGTLTTAEIRSAFIKIFARFFPNLQNDSQWNEQFDKILQDFFSIEGFLTFNGEISPSLLVEKEYLLPDFSSYLYPVKRLVCPLAVTIVFTNRCSCDCLYCYSEREKSNEYPLEQWCEFFNQMNESGIKLVHIGGGDIFMRKDVYELFNEMVSRDFVFSVSTKGYISRYNAERLFDMGIGRSNVSQPLIRPIQVSVDSCIPEESEVLSQDYKYLEKALETVSNLIKAGISPKVKTVLTALNADAAEGIVARFSKLGVKEFYFAQYSRSYYRHSDRLFLSREQKLMIKKTSARLKSIFPHLNLYFQDNMSTGGAVNLPHDKWRSRPSCSGGQSLMVVKPNGDVTLCEEVPHNDMFIVGNVFKDGIIGCWNSKKLLDFIYPDREKFKGTVCYECPEYDDCYEIKGNCFRNSLRAYGTIYDAPPECPYQKKIPLRLI